MDLMSQSHKKGLDIGHRGLHGKLYYTYQTNKVQLTNYYLVRDSEFILMIALSHDLRYDMDQ